MVISDLVDFIQSAYPPTDAFPKAPEARRPNDFGVESLLIPERQWPTNIQGIDRPLPPEWVVPGEGVQLEDDFIPSLEGQLPESGGPRPPNPDVLAYYVPFHFYRRWGIYIRSSGLVAVASMLAATSGRTTADFIDLAYHVLMQHERFHFYTEVACSRAEIAARNPLYRSYFFHPQAVALEEALANAQAIRIALRDQPQVVQTATQTWMRSQGPGYRDFDFRLGRGSFSDGRRLLSGAMIMFVSGAGATGPTEFLYEGVSKSPCPIYMVRDTAAVGILKPFPKYLGIRILVHSNDHPPPHVHLETADRRAITRLQWPSLQPLKGDPQLSSSQKRDVDSYLESFGKEIGERVQRVYGATAS